jgi:hypothetical protein
MGSLLAEGAELCWGAADAAGADAATLPLKFVSFVGLLAGAAELVATGLTEVVDLTGTTSFFFFDLLLPAPMVLHKNHTLDNQIL